MPDLDDLVRSVFRLIYWPLKRLQLRLRAYVTWWNMRPRQARPKIEGPADSPVFVFSTSWRTGSTLLQRIICASGSVFIWGEPHYLVELERLYKRMVNVQGERAEGSKQKYERLSWIPVLNPSRTNMENAFRSFLRELYLKPVEGRGYTRWGFKEVRSNAIPAARMLYELFPAAKFIFLVRDPIDTYTSIKNMPFLASFPNPLDPVKGWRKNAADFLDVIADGSLPAILIRYEDLTGDEPLAREVIGNICAHVGIPFRFAMFQELKAVVGAATQKEPLTPDERALVLSETRDIAARLGYELA